MPTSQEIASIRRILELGAVFVAPPKATKRLLDNGARLTERLEPFYTPQDRPTATRYRACLNRHGRLTRTLTSRLRQGGSEAFSQLQKFCHLASCESYLEALHLLCRLVEGAVPALVTPATFEPTPLPIVCPQSRKYVGNRPHLCLVLGKSFQFFQVSMLGSMVYRVDVLEWCEGWRVIELDGQGHSSQHDGERERVIGLPTRHLSENEVVELGWGLCRRAA